MKIRAKDISGNLRSTYDAAARRKGYANWTEFIIELYLSDEDAGEARAVLDDMEDGDLDSIV